nr:MAG TPA: carbohydrate binding domain protein [Caudoviricetes sp.]
MAVSDKRIYVLIRKTDGTFTFEPLDAMVSKGDIVEYIHYL